MLDQKLESRLSHYWQQYTSGQLTKGDIVSLFLIAYNELFPVSNWISWSPTRCHSSASLFSRVTLEQLSDLKTHPFFKKIPQTSTLGAVMNQSVFKKETLRAAQGLVHVYVRPETVLIVDYIPTPVQVLEMQSQGIRCVTLLRSSEWFYFQFDHKRNIRDFVIHDLEHIWQMFEDPTMTQAQVLFSRQLLSMVRTGVFDFLMKDPIFSTEFNYIMADMNTHPAHTYATLKSLLQRSNNESKLPILSHFDVLLQNPDVETLLISNKTHL